MKKNIDRMQPHNGRYLLESDKLINVADVAGRFEKALTPLNAIQVAEGFPVISLKSNYGYSELRDKTTAIGSGTVTNDVGDGRYLISTGTTPNSVIIFDSVERGRYVSGSIGLPGIGIAQDQTTLEVDESGRWGYFNEDDGFGFGIDFDGIFVFRRFNSVDIKKYRDEWDDPLDGTGPSGVTFSLEDVDIYRMPFRWYGAGPVSFEVAGNTANADTVIVTSLEATLGDPVVGDPNLPIRAELRNGATGRDLTARVYGRQFTVLGRYEPNRRATGAFRLSQTVGTTFVPLISFRQKQDYASVSVKSGALETLVASNNLVLQIRVNGQLTGATYTALTTQNVPATETAVEFDTAATAITGGQAIFTGLAESGLGNKSIGNAVNLLEVDLPVFQNITLCARAVTGTATVTSVFGCREEW